MRVTGSPSWFHPDARERPERASAARPVRFAAFGAPGTAVTAWLIATSFRFAGRSDWSVARAPTIDASSIYALSEPAVRCLTGESSACDTALGSTTTTSVAQPSTGGGALIIGDAVTAHSVESRSLGDAEVQLLANAVRSLGPERFGRFWKSASAIEDGFLAASGSTFVPLTLIVAARRRERAMRWFGERATQGAETKPPPCERRRKSGGACGASLFESQRSGLNRRPPDYESGALPLSYAGESYLGETIERLKPNMPWRGLEPRRLSAPPPQDGVSTNFTTRATTTATC